MPPMAIHFDIRCAPGTVPKINIGRFGQTLNVHNAFAVRLAFRYFILQTGPFQGRVLAHE
jgi:hypothetical protein